MTDQRVSGTPSPETIARVLKGMAFPAGRERVLQYAQRAYAGELIISALNRLPNRFFSDLDDLLEAYQHERSLPPGTSPAP